MGIRHTIRSKDRGTKEVPLTRKSAIRIFCKECMGWVTSEIEKCTAPLCPLFVFRTGHAKTGRKANPNAVAALKRHREKE